jgi:hypothetical protein
VLDEESGDIGESNDTPPAAASPETVLAYREALYRVTLDDTALDLRIGVVAPELDAWLARAGVAHAAIVTAENPGSRALPAAENAARTTRLAADLAARGLRSAPAENRAADGGWRERAFLILEIDEPAARELGREHGQAAIVILARGAVPRLVEA